MVSVVIYLQFLRGLADMRKDFMDKMLLLKDELGV